MPVDFQLRQEVPAILLEACIATTDARLRNHLTPRRLFSPSLHPSRSCYYRAFRRDAFFAKLQVHETQIRASEYFHAAVNAAEFLHRHEIQD
ncbi:hypothetical protein U1Q18_044741 [Sarracenia purpurea var. burkii]